MLSNEYKQNTNCTKDLRKFMRFMKVFSVGTLALNTFSQAALKKEHIYDANTSSHQNKFSIGYKTSLL
jgi:hypothetical protein